MRSEFNASDANLISYWGTLIATRTLHTYNYWKLQKKEKNQETQSTQQNHIKL